MKKVQLSGSARTNVGKKATTALRNDGRVPCVLYGQGEQVHFSVRSVDIEKIIFSADVYQVELDIEGVKKATAIIQEKQMHPVKDKPMHVDFLELNDKKPVKVSLPLLTTGASIGVMNGGKLMQPYRKLRVIGLPGDLPETITVEVAELRIGDSVRVSDVNIKGVTILEPSAAVVVGVKMARGAVDVDAEEVVAEEATEDAEEAAE